MALLRRHDYLLTAAAGLLLAVGNAQAAIYCCDDANGRRICADVLPAACYDRGYRELGKRGGIKREISAPLSREELERRRAEEARRKVEEERLVKQRRLDQALLDTYATVQDIDNRRDREIAEVQRNIEADRQREGELFAQRKRLAEEAEFYKGKALPRELQTQMLSIDNELAARTKFLATKQREITAIRERYAADRARFVELTAAGSSDVR